MRRRSLWLVAAIALLALAAFLMARGDPQSPAATEPRVQFPRGLDSAAAQRRLQRRVLPPPAEPTQGERPPPRPRDPMLAALPAAPGKTTLVLEANALFESPLGSLLLDCLRREESRDLLEELKESAGIDLRKDLDRIAVSGGVVLASGHFATSSGCAGPSSSLAPARVPWAKGRWPSSSLGATGGLRPSPSGGTSSSSSPTRPSSSRRPSTASRGEGHGSRRPLDENATYGELYGVLGSDLIDEILANGQPELAARLRDVADHIDLHVNAMGDVAMVAEDPRPPTPRS
jgi:hypothetical protein